MSNDKSPGCLEYVVDYLAIIAELYNYFQLWKIPILNNQDSLESNKGFLWLTCEKS